jgi:hypothetical protein
MNRREFLTFTSERRLRIVELSCERLYMHVLDAQLTCEPREKTDGNGSWSGEPPAVFARRTPAQLFDEIDRDLSGVDVLRITGAGWLASDALSGRLDGIVDRFRAAGGRVEVTG